MRSRPRAATCRCASRPSAAAASIRAIVEIDPATAKQPEWLSGGTLRLTFEPERISGLTSVGPTQTLTKAIDPGQRSIVDQRQRTAARGRPICGPRRIDAAQRPSAAAGDDLRHRARGGRGGGNRRSGRAARPEHRPRIRGDRRSAIPPHRALAPRSAAGQRGIHRRPGAC